MAAKRGARDYFNPAPSLPIGRTDQGVDFGGRGPVLALGDARIISTSHPSGWPGTGGILYQLLSGNLAGQYVAVYEDFAPSVRVGQTVRGGQVIGHATGGPSGIEILFATKTGSPLTPYNGAPDGTPMPAGQAMRQVIQSGQSGPLGQATNLGGTAGVSAAVDTVTGAAGDVALATAKAIVGLLADAIGENGARILLYVALVIGGGGLAMFGAARTLGIHPGALLPGPLGKVAAAA